MKNDQTIASLHERWARFRFSVIGPLLAAPPERGELREQLEALSQRTWRHPINGAPCKFSVPTIERWFYRARGAGADPVKALKKQLRKDAGSRRAMGAKLKQALAAQHTAHKSWSYLLHFQNLAVLVEQDRTIGPLPSYVTVRRFMKETGLFKRKRLGGSKQTDGTRAAEHRLESREVRSYERTHVGSLWHADFHVGSRSVLVKQGEWRTAYLFGALDDHSRLCCHLQWYLTRESAETIVHGMMQAIQKRGLPAQLMTDNGKAELSVEFTEGLALLGIGHETTLSYSPYQNGKQESFWTQIEGRVLPMLEGVSDLTLELLNEATQAWVELEYNRERHSEIGEAPVARLLRGPSVMRPSPSTEALRQAFMASERRTQRCSDGTLSLFAKRFEVPSRYRHLQRITVRYASWDLGHVYMMDERTGAVLCRLYPLDRQKNADGERRVIDPQARASEPPPQGEMAPLLKKYLDVYRKSGLPPAYVPHQPTKPEGEEDK
jgi:putative transposase